MNIYRGCQHGCIYCDARSVCYHMEHAFTDIEVKGNAPQLLLRELQKKRRRCMIATGAMSDPYMPLEQELRLTRACLEIIDRLGFGVTVQTKSDAILRDLDLFTHINAQARCVVQTTLTTFDEKLCRIVEPDVCTTARRVEMLKEFRHENIQSVVWITPILPYINDTVENLNGILEQCADAGVCGILSFGMGLTLREGDREYYYAALDRHFPGLRARYQREYGYAYELPSPNARALEQTFHAFCEKRGILHRPDEVFAFLRRFPEEKSELRLF